MSKIKFILPLIMLSLTVTFAFASENSDSTNPKSKPAEKIPFATTYFLFTGTNASQYTDSTKWVRHTSMPEEDCEGTAIACLVTSASLSTRSQLVNFIQTNGGISGQATIAKKKN